MYYHGASRESGIHDINLHPSSDWQSSSSFYLLCPEASSGPMHYQLRAAREHSLTLHALALIPRSLPQKLKVKFRIVSRAFLNSSGCLANEFWDKLYYPARHACWKILLQVAVSCTSQHRRCAFGRLHICVDCSRNICTRVCESLPTREN